MKLYTSSLCVGEFYERVLDERKDTIQEIMRECWK